MSPLGHIPRALIDIIAMWVGVSSSRDLAWVGTSKQRYTPLMRRN